jgi:hypothetical protein
MNTRKWRKSESDSLIKAQAFFEEENFSKAIPIFENIQQNHPKELYLKYVTGICGLYRNDLHEKSLELLLAVYNKSKKVPNIQYDLALAYHYNYKFDEALNMLNLFLQEKGITEKDKTSAQQLVNYCNNGKLLITSPIDAIIENIGDVVNTENYEYVPVLSSDESVMIYTYRGEKSTGGLQNAYGQIDSFGTYYEDVFISHRQNNNWFDPASIGTNINTSANDAAIAISNDGQKLFIFRDSPYDGGDIYISKLDSNSWSFPEKLQGDINTTSWEGSASLSADEKTLYFASERPGGYGGRDLYKATALPDGTWGNVTNLGPTINTALDDDAPFIHPDGQTLIYSSKGLNSMGSYDIFVSELSPTDSSWSTPKNIGYPINTTDDDRYFVLSTDGDRGYYASGKAGGYGLHDIYMVTMPHNYINPKVLMLKGNVTQEDMPTKVSIQVDVDNNKPYTNIQSDAIWGSYLVNLVPSHNYKITYKLDGFPDQTQMVDVTGLSTYAEKNVDIKFEHKKDSIPSTLANTSTIAKNETATTKTEPEKIKAPVIVTEPDSKATISNTTKEGLEFKVQIAAYSLPRNYKYDNLKNLGKIEKLVLDDDITRFTIGGTFKTLNEAIIHRDKVRKAGQTDAFVTAIYHNKRVYLKDLEQLGIILQQIK